jgi:protease I
MFILQVWYPLLRLREAGYKTITIAPEEGKVYNSKHGYPCKADTSIDSVSNEVVQLLYPFSWFMFS